MRCGFVGGGMVLGMDSEVSKAHAIKRFSLLLPHGFLSQEVSSQVLLQQDACVLIAVLLAMKVMD